MPLIPALGGQRQCKQNYEFKATLFYIVRLYLKIIIIIINNQLTRLGDSFVSEVLAVKAEDFTQH